VTAKALVAIVGLALCFTPLLPVGLILFCIAGIAILRDPEAQ
jgi:hypothetical protein